MTMATTADLPERGDGARPKPVEAGVAMLMVRGPNSRDGALTAGPLLAAASDSDLVVAMSQRLAGLHDRTT